MHCGSVLYLSELAKLSNKAEVGYKKTAVLYLSELAKLSNVRLFTYQARQVLYLSELAKLSNINRHMLYVVLFCIFLN